MVKPSTLFRLATIASAVCLSIGMMTSDASAQSCSSGYGGYGGYSSGYGGGVTVYQPSYRPVHSNYGSSWDSSYGVYSNSYWPSTSQNWYGDLNYRRRIVVDTYDYDYVPSCHNHNSWGYNRY